MSELKVSIKGVAPLLQHNERLSIGSNPHTIELAEISKKRGKSISDLENLAKIEFVGGLYFDEKVGAYVPSKWLDKALEEGARAKKKGKDFRACVRVLEDMIPIATDKKRSIEQLWNDGFYDQRPIVISKRRILRTRPMFADWSLKFSILFDELELNKSDVVQALERAGKFMGIGDYRPKFGRFTLESVNG